jgi:hypothetical protein
MKWLEYDVIHSNYECNQFFTNVFIVFKNSIKAHFVSKYVGERQIVFDINKDIIETFVSNMIYKVEDETDKMTMKTLRRILCLAMKSNKPLYLFDIERLLQRWKSKRYYCSSEPN